MKFQVIIIGGGPAGYTAAESAAKAGFTTLLIEKKNLGGVCLNEGCIPTKTLLYSAKTHYNALHAAKYAVSVDGAEVDLPKVIARKAKVVRKLVLGIKARLTNCGVQIIQGEAFIKDAHTVTCENETYETEKLVLCTGSDTFIPPIKGIDEITYWTHQDALNCKEKPESLLIIGGGVIGMEFASFFNELGTKVTIVEMMDEILGGGVDKELAALLRTEYAKRGIDFYLSTRLDSLKQEGEQVIATCTSQDKELSLQADKLLMSVGRRAIMKGYGLENLNLELTPKRTIKVNAQMETSTPGVYACGDITGFSLLAHTAVREAEVAINTIAGKSDAMSYRAIPGVVYTNPEIAGIGYTEEALNAQQIPYQAIKLPMSFSGRFVAENEGTNGLCKLLIDPNKHILGAHVLGNYASEIITLAGMAIELNLTTEEWKKIVFPHPTVGEIFREAL